MIFVLLALTAWADQPPVEADVLVRAIDLPLAAQHLRKAGQTDAEVHDALTTVRDHGLTPAEARDVLDAAADVADETGPVDNFGAFVKARLDDGLRGRELAEAIQEEHRAHGRGRPDHAGARGADERGAAGRSGIGRPDHAGDRDHDDDHDDAHEHDDDGGRPEGAGAPGQRGGAGQRPAAGDEGRGRPAGAGGGGGGMRRPAPGGGQ